jgi:hypothetical protein
MGQTIYQNICTGQTNTVPWGAADWTLAIFLMLLGFAFVAFLLIGTYRFMIDY